MGNAMADVFISYSKAEAEPTIALGRDLESSGLSVWWDTSLLPDDPHFPETIRQEITNARAAVVIWTPSSVKSRWVYAEAKMADEQRKLIQLRTEVLDLGSIPLPFNTGQIGLVTDRDALYRALERKGVKARGAAGVNELIDFTQRGLEGTTWRVSCSDGSTRTWRFKDHGVVEEIENSLSRLVNIGTWKRNGSDIEIQFLLLISGTYVGKIWRFLKLMTGRYSDLRVQGRIQANGTWSAFWISG
jgi:hypothetical protein